MATRSRIAPNIDMGRLRAALSGPGADPRTWCFEGRIDDDPDAIRWDEKLGWMCDVTVTGGQLDGEGPVSCRVMVPYAAANQGGPFHPPRTDLNVICMMPSADLNSNPIIVGYVFDDNAGVPTAFGDLEANESNLEGTHAMKSPHDVNTVFDGKLAMSFGESGDITFGQALAVDATAVNLLAANQAFVRGDDLKTALQQLMTGLDAAFAAITTAGGKVAVQAAWSPVSIAVQQLIPGTLSTKIKGE